MKVVAVVPIKPRGECKQRLGGVITPRQRLGLVRAMLDRVVAAARATAGIDEVVLLTDERDRVPADLRVLADGGVGLNSVLAEAAKRLAAEGADAIVVLPADLPFLTFAEVDVLAAIARSGGAAVAPDEAGRGTNALAVPARPGLEFAFGPDSFARHIRGLRAIGLQPVVVRSPGLAFDVDEPAALARVPELIQAPTSDRTSVLSGAAAPQPR